MSAASTTPRRAAPKTQRGQRKGGGRAKRGHRGKRNQLLADLFLPLNRQSLRIKTYITTRNKQKTDVQGRARLAGRRRRAGGDRPGESGARRADRRAVRGGRRRPRAPCRRGAARAPGAGRARRRAAGCNRPLPRRGRRHPRQHRHWQGGAVRRRRRGAARARGVWARARRLGRRAARGARDEPRRCWQRRRRRRRAGRAGRAARAVVRGGALLGQGPRRQGDQGRAGR